MCFVASAFARTLARASIGYRMRLFVRLKPIAEGRASNAWCRHRYDVREERFVPDAEAEQSGFKDEHGCVRCVRCVRAYVRACVSACVHACRTCTGTGSACYVGDLGSASFGQGTVQRACVCYVPTCVRPAAPTSDTTRLRTISRCQSTSRLWWTTSRLTPSSFR